MKEKESTTKEIQKASGVHLMSPLEEMDRLLDDVFRFRHGWMRPLRMEWPDWGGLRMPLEGRFPRVDVVDREAEILVRAELPGVDKQDIEVSMTDNTVTIKGSTRHEEKEEKGDYYRCEISRGSFSRTVALPGDVDNTKATATFKDGILELTLPKVEKSKRRTIAVK